MKKEISFFELVRDEKWANVPNFLTLLRLLAIPIMAHFILFKDRSLIAFFLFVGIWVTDILDGQIARHFNLVTNMGKVLDPLVDKIFQIVTAIAFCVIGKISILIFILLMINPILMVAGGIFLWKDGIVVSSTWYGKLTTVLLSICFATLFLLPNQWIYIINYCFLIPIILSIYSVFRYGCNYFSKRKKRNL